MSIKTSTPRRGRPPKKFDNQQNCKAILIRSGLEHFTEYGFSSSGLDQILKKVNVPKGSFYYYFSSKEEFGLAVIKHYSRYFEQKLDTWLLDDSYPPLTRIANFVEDAKNGMKRHGYTRGCLVGNLEQEIELLPANCRTLLIEAYRCWEKRISSCFKAAQIQGEISSTANCDLLAEFFWLGWEGSVSRARLLKSGVPMDNYLNVFLAGLPK